MNAQHSPEKWDASEEWDVYIASYENDKVGSTTLRMDLNKFAPLESYSYILITGIKYKTSREDGFPDKETFSIIYKIEDGLSELIKKEIPSIFVGSFTYNKERLGYFYLKEPNGIKEKLENYYKTNYPEYEYYLNIEEDKKWEYYTDFLYPNEETLNYMADESVLKQLQKNGDDLTKERRVDHWLYFPSKSDMNACKNELHKQKFTVESTYVDKEHSLPFRLQVWRIDYVEIDFINGITSELNKIAKKHNGDYDGWETSVEK